MQHSADAIQHSDFGVGGEMGGWCEGDEKGEREGEEIGGVEQDGQRVGVSREEKEEGVEFCGVCAGVLVILCNIFENEPNSEH